MSDSAAQNTVLDSLRPVSDGAPPPHLLAYARISDLSVKRRTLAGVLGVQAQHTACEAMTHEAGAIVIKNYTDNDRSASRGEHRPGFEAMLADLHRGRTEGGEPVHGVVTVDVDRIYKTPAQWERFITAFRAALSASSWTGKDNGTSTPRTWLRPSPAESAHLRRSDLRARISRWTRQETASQGGLPPDRQQGSCSAQPPVKRISR